MTSIFAGIPDIALLFILFVLIYTFNDSYVAETVLAFLSIYSFTLYIPQLSSDENSFRFGLFFFILFLYAAGNVIVLVFEYRKAKKEREEGI